MSDSQYIDRRTAARTYRPSGYMSAGLMRARKPYWVKNTLTGLAIGSFVVGIWLYSMSAVKQDNFADVDEEARAMVRAGVRVVEDQTSERNVEANSPTRTAYSSKVASGEEAKAQGLLAPLDGNFPRLLDPKGKTVVWGAPPVDRIGRMLEEDREDELRGGRRERDAWRREG